MGKIDIYIYKILTDMPALGNLGRLVAETVAPSDVLSKISAGTCMRSSESTSSSLEEAVQPAIGSNSASGRGILNGGWH